MLSRGHDALDSLMSGKKPVSRAALLFGKNAGSHMMFQGFLPPRCHTRTRRVREATLPPLPTLGVPGHARRPATVNAVGRIRSGSLETRFPGGIIAGRRL